MEIIANKSQIPQVHPNQFPDLVEFMKMPHNDLPISLYEEYYQLATELGYPAIKNYFNIQTLDKNGRLDDETGRTMSKSMLRNQWNYMLREAAAVNKTLDATFGSGLLSTRIIAGTVWTSASLYTDITGAISSSSGGLVVGRGNTAVTFEDYKLETICAEGTGANQLNYQAGVAPTVSWSAGNMEFTIQHIRYANNNSAGNIDLVESGVATDSYYALVIRDVFATKTVNIGGQVKMVYDFVSNTFPE